MKEATTTRTEEGDKIIYRRTWEHSVYEGYTITKAEVDVNRMFNGRVCGGSIRYEWAATNGTNVVEAKTLKALKQRIELM